MSYESTTMGEGEGIFDSPWDRKLPPAPNTNVAPSQASVVAGPLWLGLGVLVGAVVFWLRSK